jgi:NAD(P)-dependent dehydrogenase (short-subunit alcohol dehydrogenase family)
MARVEGFEGRHALVTGAAGGIGAALAEALVDSGASVFVSDIDAANLEQTAARIGAASAPCDVSDEEAVAELVERAASELGGLDLLCANAGVIVPGSILETRREDADYLLGVNVWGVVNSCRPFVRRLREAGRPGTILLTGSEHSLSNPAYLRSAKLHLYNLSKHAVLSIGDSLRAELASEDIGVSVLCPGPVESGLNANSEARRPARFGAQPQLDLSSVDRETIEGLGDLYMPALQAAEIALRGLAAGRFVIPTHGFEREDVEARYAEILAGFELLG